MAAPMNTRLFSKFNSQFFRISVFRAYARYNNRRVLDVMNPEQEVEYVKHRVKPADPKTNPYIKFSPDDPVQKSQANLYELSKREGKNFKQNRRKEHKRKASSGPSSIGKYVAKDPPKSNHGPRVVMSSEAPQSAHFNETDNDSDLIAQIRHSGIQLMDPDIVYTRLDAGDKRFGQVIQHAVIRNSREKYQAIVLEGRRLIKDALNAGAKLKCLYFSGRDTLHGFKATELQDAPVFKVLHKEMKIWSAVTTPQGLIGVFSMPEEGTAVCEEPNRLPITLICDGIREPGNMGTLLRTATAIGCQKIVVSKGCVDVWNNKVLRSGAGCHFRIPIVTSVNWSEMDSHVTANSQVYLADCRQPTPELLAEIAGSEKAIAAIELHKEKTEGVSLSAYPSDVDLETDDGAGNIDLDDQDDTDDDDDETLQVYKQAPMNVTDYDKVRFLSKETVLIIGGETKGISNQARKFAYNNYGQFITLPMLAGVESLNCAVAGSVILYEMGKHFRQNKNA